MATHHKLACSLTAAALLQPVLVATAVAQDATMGTEGDIQRTPSLRIPPSAPLGRLAIGAFPNARLDGRDIVLGPGFRLHRVGGGLVVPPSTGGTQHVAYRTGAMGELVEAWLLSADEERALHRSLGRARTRP